MTDPKTRPVEQKKETVKRYFRDLTIKKIKVDQSIVKETEKITTTDKKRTL
jgi:hypothetical protein